MVDSRTMTLNPERTTLAKLAAQRDIARALGRAVHGERLAHAYLFEGPRGVGKEDVAYAVGAAALCPEAPGEGCGGCNTCRRAFADLHPDFRRYEVEGAHFDLESVREIIAEAGRPPSEGPMKFALVVEPEKMTYRSDAPANAFLKTLEEPPGRTVFILLSHDPRPLLSTIVSRCVNVRFPRLSEADIAAWARDRFGVDAARAAAIARLADGTREGAAAAAGQDGAARIDAALTLLEQAASGGAAAAFAGAAAVNGRDEALDVVAALGEAIREVTVAAAAVPQGSRYPELARRAAALAAPGALKPTEELWAELARAGAALRQNANVNLTLAEFLLRVKA